MSLSDKVFQSIATCGGDAVEMPVTIEAAIPLELSGEVVRARICTFTDASGREWALRPDLTLPVAQAEVAARTAGGTGESIRRYRGPVFRLPSVSDEPIEYEQIGLERFGAARGVDEDIWLFETLTEACQAAGVESGAAVFGDLSIFPAFVDALNLPADTAAGLKRAFRQEGGVRAYLAGQTETRSGLSGRLQGLARNEISAFVEDIFAMTGVQPVGERSTDEIVERLHARAQTSAGLVVSDEARHVLDQVLSLDIALTDAPDALTKLADAAGLNAVGETLDQFAARTERLLKSRHQAVLADARFATRFGRRFTYYDGFVFEIAADTSASARQRAFAAGGRYDSLLANLSGGSVDATAIGGIVIPHRLARLAGASS